MEAFIDRIIPLVKRWGFSLLLLPFIWISLEQFWMAIRVDILYAVNYPYPFFIWPIMFVIDNVSLIIHEGGHFIFGLFGWRFLGILGGTLMGLLIPFLLFLTAWSKKQFTLAQFSLFWTGFTWLETAAYCYDAVATKMPLIGDLPITAHDFRNLLMQTKLLNEHETLAWLFYTLGVICFVMALLWPLRNRPEPEMQYQNLKLDL